MVFPRREPKMAEKNAARTPMDFAAIHEQLRGSKYVTLQLLWEEYRQANPDCYRYSRYVVAKIMLRGRESPLLAGGPLALDAT